MKRELALVAAAAVVLAATALAVVLVPGVLADPAADRDAGDGRLFIEEVDISAGEATGRTATLRVDAHLAHRGPPSENVSVAVRAVDLEGGLLATSRRVDVPTVTGDREVTVSADLAVEREGGYRVETVVYQDGRRVAEGSREVRGVGAIQPAYAETPVGFHRFDGGGADLPVVQFSVAEAGENRTSLAVSAFLTNEGDGPAGDLAVQFVARQADSGIVADRTTVSVGEIEPGRTATPSTELTVPADYNYYLDAVLWRDDVIVDTARAGARLNPSESLSVNVSRDDEGLQVGEFEGGSAPGAPGGGSADGPQTTVSAGQPGFGPAVAVLALAVAALLARRRHA